MWSFSVQWKGWVDVLSDFGRVRRCEKGVELRLFQTVGLGAEAVDLGFVGRDDDVDVADVAEIGAEHHVEAIALPVGRIGDAVHTTDEDARREDGGVARGFDDVAGTNFGVAGHIVDVGFARAAAVPE